EVAPARLSLRQVARTPMLAMDVRPSATQRIGKRLLDRVLGGLLILLALPVLLGAMVLIRAGSPGSPLYRQTRIGRDGSEFTMFKLRTMFTDADARRAALLAHSEGNDLMFKMRHDPRVTRI